MGRMPRSAIGSQRWAAAELRIAERRLRAVRRQIDAAVESELPGLLRLEASLRRECERLAKMARLLPAGEGLELPEFDFDDLEEALADLAPKILTRGEDKWTPRGDGEPLGIQNVDRAGPRAQTPAK